MSGAGPLRRPPTLFATADSDQIGVTQTATGIVMTVNGRAVIESAMFLTVRLDALAGNDHVAVSSSLVEVIGSDGDDLIEVQSPSFRRIDAGPGSDTLRLPLQVKRST